MGKGNKVKLLKVKPKNENTIYDNTSNLPFLSLREFKSSLLPLIPLLSISYGKSISVLYIIAERGLPITNSSTQTNCVSQFREKSKCKRSLSFFCASKQNPSKLTTDSKLLDR